MTIRLNKTAICSVVFLDIVEYSILPAAEQVNVKALFNMMVAEAVKNIPPSEFIMLDTGDGAAISLVGEPEEAMFISLGIKNSILAHNKNRQSPLLVRFGINLGSVRTMCDINGNPNVIGDGINDAQQIMNFAEPNQILISHSYFDLVSRITQDYAAMFSYFGIKLDKHGREHEVYQIHPAFDNTVSLKLNSETGINNMKENLSGSDKRSKLDIELRKNYSMLAIISIIAVSSVLTFGLYIQPKADETKKNVLPLINSQVNILEKINSDPKIEKNSEVLMPSSHIKEVSEKNHTDIKKKQTKHIKKNNDTTIITKTYSILAHETKATAQHNNILAKQEVSPCSQTDLVFQHCAK